MEDAIVVNQRHQELMELPPGFRFHPTDEEIITHYLLEKVMNSNFSAAAIGEADLNKSEPWDLPDKAKMGEKEWYFFCRRDRKYPTGMRTNRATQAGYWKATGKDKEIFKGKGCLVGMKKTLVFYKGRAPRGEKTNWVMHESRLEGKFSYYNLPKAAKDEWVVCRVFHKNTAGINKSPIAMASLGDEFMDYASLPPLMDPTFDCESEFKAINKTPVSSSIFNPQIPTQHPVFFHPETSDSGTGSLRTEDEASIRALAGNYSGDHIGQRQCNKVEQFSSNQSMVSPSQDTGHSTEINNNEISSVISKSFGLVSIDPYDDIEDLACLWNY